MYFYCCINSPLIKVARLIDKVFKLFRLSNRIPEDIAGKHLGIIFGLIYLFFFGDIKVHRRSYTDITSCTFKGLLTWVKRLLFFSGCRRLSRKQMISMQRRVFSENGISKKFFSFRSFSSLRRAISSKFWFSSIISPYFQTWCNQYTRSFKDQL